MIKHTIELFDRDKLFEGKNVNNQVCIFNKTILKVFS